MYIYTHIYNGNKKKIIIRIRITMIIIVLYCILLNGIWTINALLKLKADIKQ